MKVTQRMIPMGGGKRTGLKLDDATWQAVDWLATQRGMGWQDWCRSVMRPAGDPDNLTGLVRAAAMEALLSETVFADRGGQLEVMEGHPLMRDSATLNDAQYADIMKTATVQGGSDFGGFAVSFGVDDAAQPCVWIRNGLRNGLHFAFIIPKANQQ